MTFNKQTTKLETRLASPDRQRFERIVAQEAKTRTEVVRDALLYYIANYEQHFANQMESVYAEQLKKSTNRICSLLAKVGIDVHATYQFLAQLEDSQELMEKCTKVAAKRIRASLTPDEHGLKNAIEKDVS